MFVIPLQKNLMFSPFNKRRFFFERKEKKLGKATLDLAGAYRQNNYSQSAQTMTNDILDSQSITSFLFDLH